jgi:hypothetical protein
MDDDEIDRVAHEVMDDARVHSETLRRLPTIGDAERVVTRMLALVGSTDVGFEVGRFDRSVVVAGPGVVDLD